MSKLISVEFNPHHKDGPLPDNFAGCTGETLDVLYGREDRNKTGVPVRFPLLMPRTCVGYPKNKTAVNGWLPLEETTYLQKNDLSVSDRTPVSLYKAVRCDCVTLAELLAAVSKIQERDEYLFTRSKNTLHSWVRRLNHELLFAYLLKQEWLPAVLGGDVFVEARLYGLRVALASFIPTSPGAVLEVIIKHMGKESFPYASDTYLLSATGAYVETIDGVSLHRAKVSNMWGNTLDERYSHLKEASTFSCGRRPKIKTDKVEATSFSELLIGSETPWYAEASVNTISYSNSILAEPFGANFSTFVASTSYGKKKGQ